MWMLAVALQARDNLPFTTADAVLLVRNSSVVLNSRVPERCRRFELSPFDKPQVIVSVFNVCTRQDGSGKFAMYIVDLRTGTLWFAAPVPENIDDSPRLRGVREKILKARKQPRSKP